MRPAKRRRSAAAESAPDENRIQSFIIARLNIIPGVHVWRQNCGALKIDAERFVKFGVPGQADVTGVIRLASGIGQRLEVECKTEDGKSLPTQTSFGARLTSYGALYVIARELDDALVPVIRALGGRPGVCINVAPGGPRCWCWHPSADPLGGLCTFHLGAQ